MASLKTHTGPKAQSGVFFQGAGKFLNRTKQLGLVDPELDLLRRKPKHFKVCEVTGFGGMGKSRLLEELEKHAKKRGEELDHVAFVSLEAESSATEVGPLLALREKLKIDCHLFDAALVRYWNAVGQPLATERPNRFARSWLGKAVESGRGFAPIPSLPVSFAIDSWIALEKRAKIRHLYKKKSEFAEIDDMRAEPRKIRSRLPGYLAQDVKRWLKHMNQSLVVFYDSYERQDRETLEKRSPWLQELIAGLGRGVHVISSREPLRWRKASWHGLMVYVKVGQLDKSGSQEMLSARLAGLPKPIEEQLLKIGDNTPFFIESAINVYIDLAEEKTEVKTKDLPSSPDGGVGELLNHRRTPQRALATALSTVQVFDRDLYQHMADVLSVELGILHYQDFIGSFLIEELSGGLYKTHDLLTGVVRKSAEDESIRSIALEAATTHLLARCKEEGRREHKTVLAILRGLITGWSSVRSMPRCSVEALIDVAYILYDAGFSSELKSIASDGATNPRHSIAVVRDFFEALSTRRIAGVDSAIEKFERLRSRSRRLGRHRQSFKLELAYLRELGGNYFRARHEFRKLAGQAVPFDPTDRTQLRARLYHADILTMDGYFREGSTLLEETYEAVGYREIVNWGELVRHSGHAYRFSFLLEDAAELYLSALRKTPEAPGLTAKLRTNLVEAYCWFDPPRALREASRSIELNQRSGNRIELAKCHAARGIALARLKRFPEAETAIAEAKFFGKKSGYPAGIAFAMQAEAITKGLDNDPRGLRAARKRLEKQTNTLGTYGHLCVAPSLLAEGDEAFSRARSGIEWLDPDQLEARLRRYLAS